MSRTARTVLISSAVAAGIVVLVSMFAPSPGEPDEISLREFRTALTDDNAGPLLMKTKSDELLGIFHEPVEIEGGGEVESFRVTYPNELDGSVKREILDAGMDIAADPETPSAVQRFLTTLFPYILLFGIFVFFFLIGALVYFAVRKRGRERASE